MAGFAVGLGDLAGGMLRQRQLNEEAALRAQQIRTLARQRAMRAALFDAQMRKAQKQQQLIDSLPPDIQQAYALDPAIASKMFVQQKEQPALAKLAASIQDPETKAEVDALVAGGATPAEVIRAIQQKQADRIQFLNEKNQALTLKSSVASQQLRSEVDALHEGMANLRTTLELERQKDAIDKKLKDLAAATRQAKDAQTVANLRGQMAQLRELYAIFKARSGATETSLKQREQLVQMIGALNTKIAAAKRMGVAIDPAVQADLDQVKAALGVEPTAAGTAAPSPAAPPPAGAMPALTPAQQAAVHKMAPGNVFPLPDGRGIYKDADGNLRVL